MSWAWLEPRRTPTALVLGARSWAFHAGEPAAGWRWGEATDWLGSLAQATAAWPAVSRQRRALQVWLTGELCPALWLQPPPGLRAGDEWRAWLLAAAGAQHPLQEAADALSVWADAEQPAPTLAAAWPAAGVAALQRLLQPARVVSIKPLWSHALATMTASSGEARSCSVFDGEALTWVAWDGLAPTQVLTVPGLLDSGQARGLYQRRAISATVQEVVGVHLDLDAMAAPGARLQPVWREWAA